jgi:transcriptional regulator with XRE-family HTH domain
MAVSQKILSFRKQRSLSQEELAERSGVTLRTIQRIESGASVPRPFTLRAIAGALEISFEELQEEDVHPAGGGLRTEDELHFLQLLCLSCFSYIIIPWVHFLIPGWILQRKKGLGTDAIRFARKLIRGQVYWVIAFNMAMLLTLAWNLFRKRNAPDLPVISYMTTLFVMYAVNAVLIGVVIRGVKREYAG